MTNQSSTDMIDTTEVVAKTLEEFYKDFQDGQETPKNIHRILQTLRRAHSLYSRKKLKKSKLERQAKALSNIDLPFRTAIKQYPSLTMKET